MIQPPTHTHIPRNTALIPPHAPLLRQLPLQPTHHPESTSPPHPVDKVSNPVVHTIVTRVVFTIIHGIAGSLRHQHRIATGETENARGRSVRRIKAKLARSYQKRRAGLLRGIVELTSRRSRLIVRPPLGLLVSLTNSLQSGERPLPLLPVGMQHRPPDRHLSKLLPLMLLLMSSLQERGIPYLLHL